VGAGPVPVAVTSRRLLDQGLRHRTTTWRRWRRAAARGVRQPGKVEVPPNRDKRRDRPAPFSIGRRRRPIWRAGAENPVGLYRDIAVGHSAWRAGGSTRDRPRAARPAAPAPPHTSADYRPRAGRPPGRSAAAQGRRGHFDMLSPGNALWTAWSSGNLEGRSAFRQAVIESAGKDWQPMNLKHSTRRPEPCVRRRRSTSWWPPYTPAFTVEGRCENFYRATIANWSNLTPSHLTRSRTSALS